MVMMVIQPAKKRKIPNLNEQRRARKAEAIMKVKKRFTATVMPCPADRISNGNISLGTVYPSRPHDHPNATTNRLFILYLKANTIINPCILSKLILIILVANDIF